MSLEDTARAGPARSFCRNLNPRRKTMINPILSKMLQELADAEYENMRDCMELADSPKTTISCCEDIIGIARAYMAAQVFSIEETE